MDRITQKFLLAQVSRLNALQGKTDTIYRTDEQGYVIGGIPGVYCLDGAYGGYALHRMSSGGGTGVEDIFGGHMSARELSGKISAFIRGIESTKE